MKVKRNVMFKVMPDGNIRGFRAEREDLAGAAEWVITAPYNISTTITTAHVNKIYLIEER